MDVGSQGHLFTWSNRRFGPYYIEEKLDRFLCSKDWIDHFHDSIATNLVNWSSDHNPILMEVQERRGGGLNYNRGSLSRIHYEDMWSPYEACKEIVKTEWSSHGSWFRDNVV